MTTDAARRGDSTKVLVVVGCVDEEDVAAWKEKGVSDVGVLRLRWCRMAGQLWVDVEVLDTLTLDSIRSACSVGQTMCGGCASAPSNTLDGPAPDSQELRTERRCEENHGGTLVSLTAGQYLDLNNSLVRSERALQLNWRFTLSMRTGKGSQRYITLDTYLDML